MRVIVCGSRNWDDPEPIRAALAELPGDPIVIHGAARGADMEAEAAALELRLRVEVFPADWDRWGKAAGPIRNREMLESGADLVLAFQRNGSRGTQDMIDRALAAGVEVRTFDA